MPHLFAVLVLFLHVLWVLFIVLMTPLIVLGALRHWPFVRLGWLRLIHLIMMGIVVVESWVGMTCPLTLWEHLLDRAAGGAGYQDSFIGHYLHELIYYDISPAAFAVIYTVFILIILALWKLVPPKF